MNMDPSNFGPLEEEMFMMEEEEEDPEEERRRSTLRGQTVQKVSGALETLISWIIYRI